MCGWKTQKCLRGHLPTTDLAEEGNSHQSSADHAEEDGSHQLDETGTRE